MRRMIPAGLLALLALVAGPPPAHAGLVAPLSARGDLEFHADLAAFPALGGEGGARVDLAVMLRNPQLHFEMSPGGSEAVAVARLELLVARAGEVAVERSADFVLREGSQAEALSPARFQLLELPFELGAGRWAVTVRVLDLQRDRPGAADAGRAFGEATGVLEVPDFAAAGPKLAGPEFRMALGGEALPNPERLYGVAQDTLRLYLELVAPAAGGELGVDVEVLDPVYGSQDRQQLSLAPGAHEYRLPLGDFPEGNYELRLTGVWAGALPVAREFTVSWELGRDIQAGYDVTLEAELVLPDDELEAFRRLSRPAQAQRLQDFWRRHDPSPGTEANERYEIFRARLATAQRLYGRLGKPGALTDRGRIHVRYGPPDEVSVEVLPLNANELEDAILKVHDNFAMERVGTWSKEALHISVQDMKPSALEDRASNRARIGREAAFELWRYEMQGDPLFPENLRFSEDIDFSFLFVDRHGSGDYRMEYSNVPAFHGPDAR